jgi:adenylate kinase family enzyme
MSEEEDDSSSSSIILAARYGRESLNVIRSVEKNLLLVIFILMPLVAFAILDTLEVFKQIHIHDIIITILSIILTIVSISLYWFSRKSKYILHRWTKMFEENTISSLMNIYLKDRSKEEVIKSLSESIEQLYALQEYIVKRPSNVDKFMGVKVNEDLIFDILIDKQRILNENNKNNDDTINLYKEIKRYGSIIVNIVDHTIDKPAVELFFNSLLKYISLSKNKIGLAIIVGDTANRDGLDLANKLNIKNSKIIHHFMLIEKPFHELNSTV